jgi:hypothetical protein
MVWIPIAGFVIAIPASMIVANRIRAATAPRLGHEMTPKRHKGTWWRGRLRPKAVIGRLFSWWLLCARSGHDTFARE